MLCCFHNNSSHCSSAISTLTVVLSQLLQLNVLSVHLSLRFNGHSPGEPGLAGVYWSKGWWKWWSYRSCKAPVKSLPPTNQHQVFLQAGCPSCRPTNTVKALKGKYHILWNCLPQTHLGVFQLLSLTINSSWLSWGGLPCLSSALWCQCSCLQKSIIMT